MIEDDVLGRLVWNSRMEWWSGEVTLVPGQPVCLSIETEGDDDEAVLCRVRRAFQRLRGARLDTRRAAAAELLPLYNDAWNDGEAIDVESFIERMTLTDVTFYANGSAELYYDDGDLFEGRGIVLSLGADGDVEEAAIGN